MPKHIGLKDSDFDPKRYADSFGRNSRPGELTTEGIIESAARFDDAVGEGLAEEVKRGPLYLRGKA